jgi:hypothetical protein
MAVMCRNIECTHCPPLRYMNAVPHFEFFHQLITRATHDQRETMANSSKTTPRQDERGAAANATDPLVRPIPRSSRNQSEAATALEVATLRTSQHTIGKYLHDLHRELIQNGYEQVLAHLPCVTDHDFIQQNDHITSAVHIIIGHHARKGGDTTRFRASPDGTSASIRKDEFRKMTTDNPYPPLTLIYEPFDWDNGIKHGLRDKMLPEALTLVRYYCLLWANTKNDCNYEKMHYPKLEDMVNVMNRLRNTNRFRSQRDLFSGKSFHINPLTPQERDVDVSMLLGMERAALIQYNMLSGKVETRLGYGRMRSIHANGLVQEAPELDKSSENILLNSSTTSKLLKNNGGSLHRPSSRLAEPDPGPGRQYDVEYTRTSRSSSARPFAKDSSSACNSISGSTENQMVQAGQSLPETGYSRHKSDIDEIRNLRDSDMDQLLVSGNDTDSMSLFVPEHDTADETLHPGDSDDGEIGDVMNSGLYCSGPGALVFFRQKVQDLNILPGFDDVEFTMNRYLAEYVPIRLVLGTYTASPKTGGIIHAYLRPNPSPKTGPKHSIQVENQVVDDKGNSTFVAALVTSKEIELGVIDFREPFNRVSNEGQFYPLIKYYFLLAVEANVFGFSDHFIPINPTFISEMITFLKENGGKSFQSRRRISKLFSGSIDGTIVAGKRPHSVASAPGLEGHGNRKRHKTTATSSARTSSAINRITTTPIQDANVPEQSSNSKPRLLYNSHDSFSRNGMNSLVPSQGYHTGIRQDTLRQQSLHALVTRDSPVQQRGIAIMPPGADIEMSDTELPNTVTNEDRSRTAITNSTQRHQQDSLEAPGENEASGNECNDTAAGGESHYLSGEETEWEGFSDDKNLGRSDAEEYSSAKGNHSEISEMDVDQSANDSDREDLDEMESSPSPQSNHAGGLRNSLLEPRSQLRQGKRKFTAVSRPGRQNALSRASSRRLAESILHRVNDLSEVQNAVVTHRRQLADLGNVVANALATAADEAEATAHELQEIKKQIRRLPKQ